MRRFLVLLLTAFVACTAGPLLSGRSQALGVILVVLGGTLFLLSMAVADPW